MGARAGAIAAVLVLWITVRLAMRRPMIHPWLVAIVLAGAASIVDSLSESLAGRPAHITYSIAFLLGFGALVAIGEGLRTELGVAPSDTKRLATIAVICIAVAIVCGALATPRDHVIGDAAGSAFLLSQLGVLFTAGRRLVGSFLIGAGIIAYACTRTVLLGLRLRGAEIVAPERAFDVGVITLLGLGIIAFVIEGARESKPPAR